MKMKTNKKSIQIISKLTKRQSRRNIRINLKKSFSSRPHKKIISRNNKIKINLTQTDVKKKNNYMN